MKHTYILLLLLVCTTLQAQTYNVYEPPNPIPTQQIQISQEQQRIEVYEYDDYGIKNLLPARVIESEIYQAENQKEEPPFQYYEFEWKSIEVGGKKDEDDDN